MVRINGVISATYKYGMHYRDNSLMLTFYQNFQQDIQVGGGKGNKTCRCGDLIRWPFWDGEFTWAFQLFVVGDFQWMGDVKGHFHSQMLHIGNIYLDLPSV